MGHVLLNVSDVDAHRDFWTKQFDAKPVTVGKLQGRDHPRSRRPVSASAANRAERRHDDQSHGPQAATSCRTTPPASTRLGLKYDPPRIGRERTPQTYVTGPDTFRMELVEDPRLPAPAVSHHLHYWLEQPVEVKKWYVQKLLLQADDARAV